MATQSKRHAVVNTALCVACGACAKVCPQKIRIPEELAKIARLPVLRKK